ncbi:MAG: alpha/beta hydrolase [SAR324 cluster bacterium]|uniref:Alpha/beta hydrolase n=1 Tax=SAR324 cluster bacterium TaxID=2024889 RepID=A0A7X9FT77_9DELT|nr:alpha/beta hydrolase [SAR324 cluster bacterium]
MNLNSEVLGKGENSLLMLHGWGHSLEEMRPLAEILAADFQVHLIDLPGFGKSEAPSFAWGTKDFAQALVNYMDQKKIHKASVLGHSFGGRIAIRLASESPERISGLILINSSGIKHTLSFRRKLKRTWVSTLRTLIRFADKLFAKNWYGRFFIPTFASPDFKNAGPLKDTFVRIVNEDLSREASKIKTPCFLLWGEKDTETPLQMGEHLHKLISGSIIKVLPDLGHNMHLNAGANVCAYHLRPFLLSLLTKGEGNA